MLQNVGRNIHRQIPTGGQTTWLYGEAYETQKSDLYVHKSYSHTSINVRSLVVLFKSSFKAVL